MRSIMKKGTILGTIVGAALLTAAPFSLQWSQKTVALSLDSADARVGRPLTPMSVAGVHRRAYRHAAYGTAAAYGSYGSDSTPSLQAMAMGATTGRAIGAPAEWRSIVPAGIEARATRKKRPWAGVRPARTPPGRPTPKDARAGTAGGRKGCPAGKATPNPRKGGKTAVRP